MSGVDNLKKRGRPPGSKNRLSESFLAALADDFEEHGKECIAKARLEDNTAYLRIIASLQPKELNAATEGDLRIRWMTNDELEMQIRSLDVEIDALRLEEKKAKLIEALPHEMVLIDTGISRGATYAGAQITRGPAKNASDTPSDQVSQPPPPAIATYRVDFIGEPPHEDNDYDPLEP